jgi:hypothetical protein
VAAEPDEQRLLAEEGFRPQVCEIQR